MRIFQTEHEFKYSWQTLTLANWRKYPNDKASHVVAVDVLNRSVDESGVLRTERLITCHQNVPSILRKLGLPIPETCYFREVSELNPQTSEYKATTYNLSMTNVCSVEETCVFTKHPRNQNSTLFVQKGHVTAVQALSYLGRLVEDAAVNRFYSNAQRGRDALEQVVVKVMSEANKWNAGIEEFVRNFDQQPSLGAGDR